MDHSQPLTPPPKPETKILEINLISAQNLKLPPSTLARHLHTYALAYVDPNTKLRSNLDCIGGENPTWNDKFIFRVSQDFVNGDTSAVQFQIYAVGYLRDYFIGNVRYLLSSSPISTRSGAVMGIAGFSALHIRRPSGRVNGVLNIAATVYNDADFPSLKGVSAICFGDMIGRRNGERKISRCMSRGRGQETSSEEADGTESTRSSVSAWSTTALIGVKKSKSLNSNLDLAGKGGRKSDGGDGGLLCGLLVLQRKSSPVDQNVSKWVKD